MASEGAHGRRSTSCRGRQVCRCILTSALDNQLCDLAKLFKLSKPLIRQMQDGIVWLAWQCCVSIKWGNIKWPVPQCSQSILIIPILRGSIKHWQNKDKIWKKSFYSTLKMKLTFYVKVTVDSYAIVSNDPTLVYLSLVYSVQSTLCLNPGNH